MFDAMIISTGEKVKVYSIINEPINSSCHQAALIYDNWNGRWTHIALDEIMPL